VADGAASRHSLWKLISALLVVGRTLIIEQEISSTEALHEKIADRTGQCRTGVPSYLKFLGPVWASTQRVQGSRVRSGTGEALKRSWSSAGLRPAPHQLVNAMTHRDSDDTNHGSYARRGRTRFVGAPSTMCSFTLSTSNCNPCPLRAREIVFSGVCVGRGH